MRAKRSGAILFVSKRKRRFNLILGPFDNRLLLLDETNTDPFFFLSLSPVFPLTRLVNKQNNVATPPRTPRYSAS